VEMRAEAVSSQRWLSEELREASCFIQRSESLERRVDVAEFIAIAKAVGVASAELFRQAGRLRVGWAC
jgi:hypothetical protein